MGPVKSEKPVQRTTRITSFEYLGQKWGVFESLTFLHSLGFADSACQLRDALWLDDLQNRFLVKPLIYLEKNDGVLTGRRKNFELGVFLKFGWGNKRWKGYTEESNLGACYGTAVVGCLSKMGKETPPAKRDALCVFTHFGSSPAGVSLPLFCRRWTEFFSAKQRNPLGRR